MLSVGKQHNFFFFFIVHLLFVPCSGLSQLFLFDLFASKAQPGLKGHWTWIWMKSRWTWCHFHDYTTWCPARRRSTPLLTSICRPAGLWSLMVHSLMQYNQRHYIPRYSSPPDGLLKKVEAFFPWIKRWYNQMSDFSIIGWNSFNWGAFLRRGNCSKLYLSTFVGL